MKKRRLTLDKEVLLQRRRLASQVVRSAVGRIALDRWGQVARHRCVIRVLSPSGRLELIWAVVGSFAAAVSIVRAIRGESGLVVPICLGIVAVGGWLAYRTARRRSRSAP